MAAKTRFINLTAFIILLWCCYFGIGVNGAIYWRSPTQQDLTSEPPPYIVNKNTFQFVKNRITVPAKNYSSSIWPTPSPFAQSLATIKEDDSSKASRNFYKLFYGISDNNVLKKSTTISPPPQGRLIIDNKRTQDLGPIHKASTHWIFVKEQAKCSIPKPKVIRVRDVYPDVTKNYQPHCTILHRCSDDVSCCSSEAYTCGPKMIQEVEVYFYAIHALRGSANNEMENAVQKLLFENHTECECQPINDTPRSLRSETPPPSAGHHHHHHHSGSSSSSPNLPAPSPLVSSWSSFSKNQNNPNSTPWRTYNSRYAPNTQSTPDNVVTTTSTPSKSTTLAPPVTLDEETLFQLSGYNCPTNNKCPPCPRPFTMRIYGDGRCSCDCFEKDRPCLKIKRGKEALKPVERRCVEQARCHIPDCEYMDHGSYNYDTGKCPKRPDNYRSKKDGRPNHHRENFEERD